MQEITLARLQLDLLGASIGKDPAVADELAALSDLLQEASLRLQTLTHMLAPRIHIV